MRFASGRSVCAVASVAVLAAAGQARGSQVVYSTGFENPPFATGSQLLGQDGWSTAIPPFLNPAAAVVAAELPAAGAQAVRVSGGSLQAAAEVSPYTAIGSYRRPVDYNAGATGLTTVRVEADVRLDGPGTTGTDTAAASLAARSGSGPVGEIEVSSDGLVKGYASNLPAGTLTPTFTAPVTLGAYHRLAIEVDFAADTYRFFVDGAALGTPLPFDAGFTSDVLARGALVTYARGDAGARDAYTYRFDNFAVTAVPEPAAAGTVMAGTAGLLGARRRRRRSA